MSSNVAVQPSRRTPPHGKRVPRRPPWSELPAWLALVSLLAVCLPLFLCLSLWCDTTYYGVWAWEVVHGRVLEKELNAFCKPPAMAWTLAVPLALVGWRPEVVRLTDLAFVTGIICLLVRWLKPLGVSRAGRVWTAVALYGFYLSTGEWCHAQPDVWMMLPALGALYFRRRQVADALAERGTAGEAALNAAAEGFLWGLACLFKPFVVLPGGLTWLLSTLLVFLRKPAALRRLAVGTLGLLAGGLFAGGIWMAWLWLGGGWSYFWDDFRVWSGGYYSTGPSFWRRTLYLFTQFFPWGLVNAAGLVIAAGAVWRAVTARGLSARAAVSVRVIQECLLAGLYLGWLVVGNYIQFQFDYHVVPSVLLGLVLVAGRCPRIFHEIALAGRRWVVVRVPCGRLALRRSAAWALLLAVTAFVAWRHPLLRKGRLQHWAQCLRAGSTAELQDDLAQYLYQQRVIAVNRVEYNLGGGWDPGHVYAEDLERVADFLRRQQVRDGEVVCFGTHTIALLLDLDIGPSSRLLLPRNVATLYHDKLDLLCREMSAHIERQRFAVTDLSEAYAWPPANPEDRQALALPADFSPELAQTFPWYEPVVFRSGPYLVHRISGPVRALHE